MARSWWLIPGDGRALRYSSICACCGCATEERWDVVPYCAACRAHVPTIGPWLLAIGVVAIGGATALLLRAHAAFASLPVHLAIVAVATVAPLAIVELVRARRRVGAPHVDRLQAAEIARAGLLARSREWAERVAADNDVRATSVAGSPFAVLDRVLPFIACVVPIVFAFELFPQWHFTLWIDNGMAREVAVRADDHVVAAVSAGQQLRVTVPRTVRHLEATDDEDVSLGAEPSGTWVLNVGRAHCYERRGYGYSESGKGFFIAPRVEHLADHLFEVEASWFFQAPPNTIRSESTPVVATLPEIHFALEIVSCAR